MAEEIICISPTTTSGVTIPPDWHGDLAIYAEKWTISRGEGIALWCVCGEGPLCPEYQWSVSGNGFHFDSSAGPTTGETQKQFEIIELWADNKACGTATVTVIDDCGKTDTAYIRGTKGKWANRICIWGNCDAEIGNHKCGNTVFGKYKYRLRWYTTHTKPDMCLCGEDPADYLMNNDPYALNSIGGCSYGCGKSRNLFHCYKTPYGGNWHPQCNTLRIERFEWTCR
jgi:hypothetical protein